MQRRHAYWVNCFLCNTLVKRRSESDVQEIGVPVGEHPELHFWAHLECMRAVASSDFRFPSDEDLEETRRWVRQLEEEDADVFGEEAGD